MNKRRNKCGKKRRYNSHNKTKQKYQKQPKENLSHLSIARSYIFKIGDDIWIDIICCLSFRELSCMKRACKNFNKLYQSTQNINKMDNRFNIFWKNNCFQLCCNLSPNYIPQPNWHEFFCDLRKLFVNSEFEHKYEWIKTSNKIEFYNPRRSRRYKHMEKCVEQFDDIQSRYYIGNLKNIKMIDDFRAFYLACRIDSVMIFKMLLSKPKYNNNILYVFDSNVHFTFGNTYRYYYYDEYLSHYASFRRGQKYWWFEINQYRNTRVISKGSETILLTTLLKLIQAGVHSHDTAFIAPNKVSIQILRYLFKQFSDEIGTSALIYGIIAPHKMKLSLLIDAIYFSGRDKIVRLFLAHPAMTKEIINFKLNPSVISTQYYKCQSQRVEVEFSNAIECMCCMSPSKAVAVDNYLKPDTILDLIRKSDYNINTQTPSKGDTPLHLLCKLIFNPYFENIAKILLKAKDVVGKLDFNVKNNDGNTVLMVLCGASASTNYSVFRTLLEIETLDVNVQNNNGDTALIMLCGPRGDFECLKLFLTTRKDVDILLSNNDNCNAFHCVSESGDVEKIKWFFQYVQKKLKNKHTDLYNFINQQNDRGYTPYMMACCSTQRSKIDERTKMQTLQTLIHTCEVDISIKSNTRLYGK